jgi:hypothetical protein
MSIRAVPDKDKFGWPCDKDKPQDSMGECSTDIECARCITDAIYATSPEITAEMLTEWVVIWNEHNNIHDTDPCSRMAPGEFIYKKMEELLK